MFPLHGVLVVITVVVFINVSSVRTEAKARKYQARCSGLVSYLMGRGRVGGWGGGGLVLSLTESISTPVPRYHISLKKITGSQCYPCYPDHINILIIRPETKCDMTKQKQMSSQMRTFGNGRPTRFPMILLSSFLLGEKVPRNENRFHPSI